MITLIAESKTMSPYQHSVSDTELKLHCPKFQDEAEKINGSLSCYSFEELSRLLKISIPTSVKVGNLISDFGDKSTGLETLQAFTGEVFRGLDVSTLSDKAKRFSQNHLHIVSSLYGILRPDDIIKPYRFDYDIKLKNSSTAIARYWRPILTIAFVKHIKENGIREVLNLLPIDAAKCLDWKIIKAFSQVSKPDFKIIGPDGSLRAPSTGLLKKIRGKLLRKILEREIDSLSDILKLKDKELGVDPDFSLPGYPVFVYYE